MGEEKKSQVHEEAIEPYNFTCGISNRFVFCFSAWMSNGGLLARAPRDKVSTKENTITYSGFSVFNTTYLISIRVGNEETSKGRGDMETIV